MPINSTPFVPQITSAGLAAEVNARNNGHSLAITHVALGTGQRTPDGSETGLVALKLVSPIGGGGRISPTAFRIHAAFQAAPNDEFDAGEVGFYAGDPFNGGVLFAYYSTEDATKQPLVFASDQFYVSTSYTLNLSALPDAAVTVTVDQNASTVMLLIGNHETAADPHPQYLQSAEIDVENLILQAKKACYPVGSMFVTNQEGNPSDLLGFGNWQRIEGMFIAGASTNASDPDFFQAGTTGGLREQSLSVFIPSTGWGTSGGSPGSIEPGRLVVGSGAGEVNEILESLRAAGNGRYSEPQQLYTLPPFITRHIWERLADVIPEGSGTGFDPNATTGGTLS